ncbi:MAG: hypothetical protein JWM91_1411 [Rhodospirillales bacterium]|nr:hypothetical protein [Rhodospirillales bacterium]
MYVIQEGERSAGKQPLINLFGADMIKPPGRSLGFACQPRHGGKR